MASWPDEQVAILSSKHPNWDIWYVKLYPVGYLWCAKRHDHEIAEINDTLSPDELETAIDEVERSQQ